MSVTLAGELWEAKPDAFADSLRFSSPRGDLLSAAWNADDATLDGSILVAQASGAGGTEVFVQANNAGGASVGVSQPFSTWSDLTAMFRPSRWQNPFREGGTLSWLNYKAWANVPHRTAKVFVGEAIVIGTTCLIINANSGGDDPHDDGVGTATPVTPVASSSHSGGDSSSGMSTASSSATVPDGGGSATVPDSGGSEAGSDGGETW